MKKKQPTAYQFIYNIKVITLQLKDKQNLQRQKKKM